MPEKYFLSIKNQYVNMIKSGYKQWEFRKNIRFGVFQEIQIQTGDILFPIRINPSSDEHLTVDCMCKIKQILRGEELVNYFANKNNNHWKQAGCDEYSERNWDFFKDNILNSFLTGIQLETKQITPMIDITQIRHRVTQKSWNGIGLNLDKRLKKFQINNESIAGYLDKVVQQQLKIEN